MAYLQSNELVRYNVYEQKYKSIFKCIWEWQMVQKDFSYTIVAIINGTTKKFIVACAPTGSGKTFMIYDVISITTHQSEEQNEGASDIVYIILSLSKAGIAKQTYDKCKFYMNNNLFEYNNVKPYLIGSNVTKNDNDPIIPISDEYNTYILPKELLIVTGKTASRIEELFVKLKKLGKKIYVVHDEAHIAANNFEQYYKYIDRVIDLTATPKEGVEIDCLLPYSTCVEVDLIKQIEMFDKQIYTDAFVKGSQQYKAFDSFFKEFIRRKIIFHNHNKNGCLIISINNAETGEKDLKTIITYLNEYNNNLSDKTLAIPYVYIGNNNRIITNIKEDYSAEWYKEHLKDDDCIVSVIIHKEVLSEGIDIPRAFAYFQIRNSHSNIKNIQNIGRTIRNDFLLHPEIKQYYPEDYKILTTALIGNVKFNEDINADGHRVFLRLNENSDIKQIMGYETYCYNIQFIQKIKIDLGKFVKKHENDDKIIPNKFKQISLLKALPEYIRTDIDQYIFQSQNPNKDAFIILCNVEELVNEYKKKTLIYNTPEAFVSNGIHCIQDEVSFYCNDDDKERSLLVSENENIYEEVTQDVKKCNLYSNNFHIMFDSIAEKVVYQFLESVCKKINDPNGFDKRNLLARNYYEGSTICYEYYDDENCEFRKKYPDFVFINKNDRRYILEAKAENSKDTSFKEKYEHEVKLLKKHFKMYSVLNHNQCFIIFVLNLKDNTHNTYTFYVYNKGEEYIFTNALDCRDYINKN